MQIVLLVESDWSINENNIKTGRNLAVICLWTWKSYNARKFSYLNYLPKSLKYFENVWNI